MTDANSGTANNDTSTQEPSQAVQELQVCRPPADHLGLPCPCYLCPCYLCNSVHVTYVALVRCIPLQCPSCIVLQFSLYESRTLEALSTGDETAKLTSTRFAADKPALFEAFRLVMLLLEKHCVSYLLYNTPTGLKSHSTILLLD